LEHGARASCKVTFWWPFGDARFQDESALKESQCTQQFVFQGADNRCVGCSWRSLFWPELLGAI
jgi:hypothetical protein